MAYRSINQQKPSSIDEYQGVLSVATALNSFNKHRTRVWSLLIFLGVLLVYVTIRTKNFYWDGIGLAYNIEHAESNPLLHPNHLLFGPLGYAVWRIVAVAFPAVRALDVLQIMSAAFGAAAVAVLYRTLRSTFESEYLAASLALGFAFSAAWWRFATDADSYVPSCFFLVLGLFLVSSGKPVNPIWLGCVHAAGMLLHELAVLFAPALIVGLWYQQAENARRRLVTIGVYGVTATTIIIVAYSAALVQHSGTFGFAALLRWVTSYSSDASFSFDISKNAVTSLAGQVKLFLGGRIPLIRSMWNRLMMVTVSAVIALCTVLIIQFRKGFKFKFEDRFKPIVWISVVWIVSYSAFLLFWLPHNTFYRLFYLPGLFMLAGALAAAARVHGYRLALGAAILFFWNLGFYIFPYAQPAANGTLQAAQAMQKVWVSGTVVYWNVFASDNVTLRYFNPQVAWQPLWERVWVVDIQRTMDSAFTAGNAVWFDLPALERFRTQDPEFRAWLETHCRIGTKREFANGDHTVGFVQLLPAIDR